MMAAPQLTKCSTGIHLQPFPQQLYKRLIAVARNSKVKEIYNQHARDLTNLEPGTTVRIRTDKEKSWS